MAHKKTILTIPQERTPMREQEPALRVGNFSEVACGYSFEDAVRESGRCLMCADEPCIAGCPVGINIPGFIQKLTERNYRGAYDILTDTNLLPSICGRVCPQESQCEKVCTVGYPLEAVAIGRLERFVGDTAISEGWITTAYIEANPFRVGIVGSGPAGMACAADMARAGCEVTVYDALDKPGGVLRYGIPDFRLPDEVIEAEINHLRDLGVKFECNTPVGRLFSIEQMITEMGFDAVFVGVGAGYPKALDIPGDSLKGVLSASELLTHCNAMGVRNFPNSDTPLSIGVRVAIVGANNAAIDAARLAIRLGAEKVICIVGSSRTEAPARTEEIIHAEQEGVEFRWLATPVAVLDDGKGHVRGIRCVHIEPGEQVAGSEFDADLIVYSIGAQANPVIGQTSRLKLNKSGYVDANGELATSVAGVFAGGDIVSGGATVIEAMGAGRKAAHGMKAYLGIRDAMQPYINAGGTGRLFGIGTSERNFARVRIAGSQPGEHRDAVDGLSLRPALFSGYRDLARLRHDFPVVLVADPADGLFAQSLSAIIDRALDTAARGNDIERIRKHALRLEQEIRTLVASGETGSLSALWDKAATRLPKTGNQSLHDSLRRTRDAIKLDGELASCDSALPTRLLQHAWVAVEKQKAEALRKEIDGLTVKLTGILKNGYAQSAGDGKRLRGLLDAFNTQRLLSAPADHRSWLFDNCADALRTFRERMPQLIELAQAIAIAELEVEGRYSEPMHDAVLEQFDADGLDPQGLSRFPGYLVCINATDMQAAEHGHLMEILSSGLPIKVLFQIDDIFEELSSDSGTPGSDTRNRQIARTAIGLDKAYVLQSASSNLVRFSKQLLTGLTYRGPALFSVFSGASGIVSGLPPYLVSAAAMESRAFPAFTYDPSAGPEQASHFNLGANSQTDLDWPVARFVYEDEQHQRLAEEIAFTWADFVASDPRCAGHLARVPREQWNDNMISVSETLAREDAGLPDMVPTLLMVDADNGLHKVIADQALVGEARRGRAIWRNLQEWNKSRLPETRD